eukprot:1263571-Pleurochrysis_carterae.AAC.1
MAALSHGSCARVKHQEARAYHASSYCRRPGAHRWRTDKTLCTACDARACGRVLLQDARVCARLSTVVYDCAAVVAHLLRAKARAMEIEDMQYSERAFF